MAAEVLPKTSSGYVALDILPYPTFLFFRWKPFSDTLFFIFILYLLYFVSFPCREIQVGACSKLEFMAGTCVVRFSLFASLLGGMMGSLLVFCSWCLSSPMFPFIFFVTSSFIIFFSFSLFSSFLLNCKTARQQCSSL